MDPWLERYWESVHHRIIQYICDQIQPTLPRDLFADVEVTVYILDSDEERGKVKPDVAVLSRPTRGNDLGVSPVEGSSIAVAEPVRLKIPIQPIEEGHVVIRSLRDRQPLVTAIEVLSPTNKNDVRGRRIYKQKRDGYYDGGVNTVEIDLLRAGVHLIDVPLEMLEPDEITPYKAVVRRSGSPDGVEAEYYPLPLRQRLPRIALPLRAKDRDIVLDLQQPLDLAYERGRYGSRIDYASPPEPPLSAEDVAWATEIVSRSST
jgi:hypothetical protein